MVCSFIERTFMATSSDARMATELGYLFILGPSEEGVLCSFPDHFGLGKETACCLSRSIGLYRQEGGRLEVRQSRVTSVNQKGEDLTTLTPNDMWFGGTL